ncbi:MAG TPA: FUSC family protein [Candidatus Limnocylindrales bacterium]|nr:FUSC family protein [Candidatus Limnocylindrales bacterium]
MTQSDLGDRRDGGGVGAPTGGGAPAVSKPANQRSGRLRSWVLPSPGGGDSDWLIPFARAVTVLVSSYVIRVKTMWRQAPITATIVIAAGISHGSKVAGIESGLHKVAEVRFGCFVGLVVSRLMSKIWLVQPPAEKAGTAGSHGVNGKAPMNEGNKRTTASS